MQRLKSIILINAMLIACVGCDDTSTPVDSPTTQADSTTTPVASTTAPAVATASAVSTTTPAQPTTTPAASANVNDTDPSILYSRGNSLIQDWQYFHPSQEDHLQDEHSSHFVRSGGAITGAGVVVNFDGTGITWIGKKGPEYGMASYSIDGGAPQTVDNYNSTKINQNSNVTVSGLSADSHVLSISLLDKKQAASTDYWQTIDAFNIQGSTLSPTQATTAGFDSAELKFAGTWDGGRVSDGSDLSGGHYWSKATNASVSWTFVGSLIEVFGRPDYEDGYMNVYIDTDPNPAASVNGHFGSVDDDSLNSYMLFAKKLAPGQHTIKLVVAGKHDATARDNYVQIDEFIAFQ
jgi:hypothetical protein